MINRYVTYVVFAWLGYSIRTTLSALAIEIPGGSRPDTMHLVTWHTLATTCYITAVINVGVRINAALDGHTPLLAHELGVLVGEHQTSRSTVYGRMSTGVSAVGDDGGESQLALAALNFNPYPADLAAIELPISTEAIIGVLARNAHDVWALEKLRAGWNYGKVNDVSEKLHADLVAYDDLGTMQRSYDFLMVEKTLKAIVAHGFAIRAPRALFAIRNLSENSLRDLNAESNRSEEDRFIDLVERSASGVPHIDVNMSQFDVQLPKKYHPKPFNTMGETVSKDISELAETLAEHAHDSWARSRLDQGYRYGPSRSDDAASPEGLRHPLLIPYAMLPDRSKVSNRSTTIEIVKTLQLIGYSVEPVVKNRCTICWEAAARSDAALTQLQSLVDLAEHDGTNSSRATLLGYTITSKLRSTLVGEFATIALSILGATVVTLNS